MKRFTWMATTAAVGVLALSACASTTDDDAQPAQSQTASETTTSETPAASAPSASGSTTAGHEAGGMAGHQHNPDGGPPPQGIEEAADPTYPVGSTVILTADHMPGMAGTEATISGAFDTTAYSVSFTPTTGGEPVTDHKWVAHEELEDPGEAPLPDGAEVVLNADHMAGMDGAEATIDSSTDETVYMVDFEMDGMEMTNHKWVTESEMQPSE